MLVEILGSHLGYFRQYTYMMRYGLIETFSNGTAYFVVNIDIENFNKLTNLVCYKYRYLNLQQFKLI